MVILFATVSLSLLVYCGLRALDEWQKEQTASRLGIESERSKLLDKIGLLKHELIERRRYPQLIQNQLPDLIIFLTNALKASLSIRQAFEEAALELPPPLGKEIHQLVQELSLGLSLQQALKNFSTRVPLEDVNLLATAITIASLSGGNLILTLETLSQTIRERLWLRREVKVLTAQGRFSGLVLSALPIGVLCFLTLSSVQDAKRFLSLPSGWLILIVGLTLNLVGFLLIQKITNIEAVEKKHLSSLEKALPEAIDLLSILVTAGLNLNLALPRMASKLKGVLGEEMKKTCHQIDLGIGRRQALKDLADRNNSARLRSFVLSITQAERYGTPISEVLKVQSQEARLMRRQQAEELARKAPIKLLFPLVFLILPSFLVLTVGPVLLILTK